MSRIKTKLLGENDENVNYIAKDTGATICLRGKGSGFENIDGGIHEPLHIVVK